MLQAQWGITNIMLLNGYSTKLNPSELWLYPWIHRYIQLSPLSSDILLLAVDGDQYSNSQLDMVLGVRDSRMLIPKGTHVTHHTTKTWESLWMREYKHCKKSLWWMSPMKHYLLYTLGRPYIWIHRGSGSMQKNWFSLKLEKFQNGKESWTHNSTLTSQAIAGLDTRRERGKFL